MARKTTLDTLATEAINLLDKSEDYLVAAGRLLLQAQQRVWAGEAGDVTWAQWYEANVRDKLRAPVSMRTAQRYMHIAAADNPGEEAAKYREHRPAPQPAVVVDAGMEWATAPSQNPEPEQTPEAPAKAADNVRKMPARREPVVDEAKDWSAPDDFAKGSVSDPILGQLIILWQQAPKQTREAFLVHIGAPFPWKVAPRNAGNQTHH